MTPAWSGDSRIGDLNNVGHHIRDLTKQIREKPASETDLNWRLAFALDQTARSLLREPTSQRLSFSDLRSEISTLAIHRARTPVWRSSLELKSFSEHYNAQTIESAYVPNLFVLPAHATWLSEVRTLGPQVISGMRGCGKTMLLKSLDFHARAFREQGEQADEVISKLKKIGLSGYFWRVPSCWIRRTRVRGICMSGCWWVTPSRLCGFPSISVI